MGDKSPSDPTMSIPIFTETSRDSICKSKIIFKFVFHMNTLWGSVFILRK